MSARATRPAPPAEGTEHVLDAEPLDLTLRGGDVTILALEDVHLVRDTDSGVQTHRITGAVPDPAARGLYAVHRCDDAGPSPADLKAVPDAREGPVDLKAVPDA